MRSYWEGHGTSQGWNFTCPRNRYLSQCVWRVKRFKFEGIRKYLERLEEVLKLSFGWFETCEREFWEGNQKLLKGLRGLSQYSCT